MLGPYLCLVLSQQEYDQALDHCNIAREDRIPWIKTSHSHATVHTLENKSGEMVCIVALKIKEGVTGIQICGLLCHEAVHIFQSYCERIGESHPSAEFEAYSIQQISQNLMEAYARQAKVAI